MEQTVQQLKQGQRLLCVDHCFQKAGFDKEQLFYTQETWAFGSVPNHAVKKAKGILPA